jgi:hypothetical protein
VSPGIGRGCTAVHFCALFDEKEGLRTGPSQILFRVLFHGRGETVLSSSVRYSPSIALFISPTVALRMALLIDSSGERVPRNISVGR